MFFPSNNFIPYLKKLNFLHNTDLNFKINLFIDIVQSYIQKRHDLQWAQPKDKFKKTVFKNSI